MVTHEFDQFFPNWAFKDVSKSLQSRYTVNKDIRQLLAFRRLLIGSGYLRNLSILTLVEEIGAV